MKLKEDKPKPMRQMCKNCCYARTIPPPIGEQPPDTPEKTTHRFLCFSWQTEPHNFDRVVHSILRSNWLEAMNKHEQQIRCTRYPSTKVKWKTDFCGEFKQKEEE
jgi:hypothetical protein